MNFIDSTGNGVIDFPRGRVAPASDENSVAEQDRIDQNVGPLKIPDFADENDQDNIASDGDDAKDQDEINAVGPQAPEIQLGYKSKVGPVHNIGRR